MNQGTTMTDLKTCLDVELTNEFLTADKKLTKETLQIRILKRILNYFKISKNDLRLILDPEVIFIHPQISEYLNQLVPMEKYSSDYHLAKDVDAFCDLLDERITTYEKRCGLNKMFAVDGFRGIELKNYKDNLRICLRETPNDDWETRNEEDLTISQHVHAVRYLYEKHGSVKPEIIQMSIQNAFDGTKSSNGMINTLAESYKEFQGEKNLEAAKELIESKYVCYKL